MGYSCTVKADKTLKQIAWMLIDNGSANTYSYKDKIYFWEIGRENKSGAISGKVYEIRLDGKAIFRENFYIAENGYLMRGPSEWRKALKNYTPFKIID